MILGTTHRKSADYRIRPTVPLLAVLGALMLGSCARADPAPTNSSIHLHCDYPLNAYCRGITCPPSLGDLVSSACGLPTPALKANTTDCGSYVKVVDRGSGNWFLYDRTSGDLVAVVVPQPPISIDQAGGNYCVAGQGGEIDVGQDCFVRSPQTCCDLGKCDPFPSADGATGGAE